MESSEDTTQAADIPDTVAELRRRVSYLEVALTTVVEELVTRGLFPSDGVARIVRAADAELEQRERVEDAG